MSLTPIADFVRAYAASDTSRLHMPGHKGTGPLGCEALDLTEIAGADELYEAEGIIAQSEAVTARLFGTAGTWYGAEGSSQCIRAMLFLALQAAPKGEGRPVLLAARNAHKALLYAAALLDFDVRWLWPPAGPDASLCACPVSPDRLSAALDALAREGRRPFGVYLTSPDYLGGVQDVAALAPLCHARGVPLLVDNAHGAYLRFLPGGSRHPIDLGADLCCDSAHKTLPVLTGGAYLHAGRGLLNPDPADVRGGMCLFGSTSPSYLILQSLDLCAGALAGDWPAHLADCIQSLDALKAQLDARCPGLVRPSEPLKLVLDGAAAGRSGQELAEVFRAHRVECEYADPRYLVLMFTPHNPLRDFDRVRDAALDAIAHPGTGEGPAALPAALWEDLERQAGQPACTIRQAVLGCQVRLPAREALGRVCALPTVSCPPAIPIAVSGETIGPAALRLLEAFGIGEVSVLA